MSADFGLIRGFWFLSTDLGLNSWILVLIRGFSKIKPVFYKQNVWIGLT